jgi:hypothetical protein
MVVEGVTPAVVEGVTPTVVEGVAPVWRHRVTKVFQVLKHGGKLLIVGRL